MQHPANTCHAYRRYKALCKRIGKQPTPSGFADYCTAATIPKSAELLYTEGYHRALVDVRAWLTKALPGFKSDRKRNNAQNVIWLLDCLCTQADLLAVYGDALPVEHQQNGREVVYSVAREWPLPVGREKPPPEVQIPTAAR